MSYSVTNVLTDLAGVIHGTTTNKIPNVYGILNRAARAVLLDVDPKETQRIVQLSQIFNNVFDYALPVDVKGDRFIDLRLQAGRKPSDIFTQGYELNFDAYKGVSTKNKIYTQWNTGVKTLRIEAPTLTAPVTLTDTSTITGWVAGGGATTPTLDTLNNVAGGGALVFNLQAGQSSGYIENSTLNALDLTSHLNVSTLFDWNFLPKGSSITSINIRWGSSAANYYSQTAIVNQQGIAFQNGWNLGSFTWSTASVVGTPIISSIAYVRFTLNYDSTLQTGVKVCNLTSNLGYIFEAVYYSKYLFRDPTTNAFQETVVDVTDNNKLINLDTESYNLFFNKVAFYTAQSLQGADAQYDAMYWGGEDGQGGEYGSALKRYRAENPSEALLKGSTYYQVNPSGYNKFLNMNFPK